MFAPSSMPFSFVTALGGIRPAVVSDEYEAMKAAGTLDEDVLYVTPVTEQTTIAEATEMTATTSCFSGVRYIWLGSISPALTAAANCSADRTFKMNSPIVTVVFAIHSPLYIVSLCIKQARKVALLYP